MTGSSRRVRIDLAYDGTAYCGWQWQANGPTVQGAVEEVLAALHGGARIAVRGASRTDAGVHAHGQVADCEVRLRLDDDALAYALRRMLPDDVRPLRVRTVDPEFHSRKDARSKSYEYRLDRSAPGDPFTRLFALHHPAPLAERPMREALALLPGRRNWTGFTTPRSDKEDPVRELMQARLEVAPGGGTTFVFEADGFLRYMVRNLVGTLLEIGKGRMPPERVREIVDRADPTLAGPTAPPRGLHLIRVRYADDAG